MKEIKSQREMLTKDEVVDLLRISPSILDRLIKNKEIPYIKLAPGRKGRILFHKSDIDKFLESKLIK
jgi:excisionase family DNA binding protein